MTSPHFTRFRAERYTPVIGALIHDIDLAAPLDETARQELRTALAHFDVLFFRRQKLDAQQQIEIASIFGTADGGKAYFPTSAENPIIEVLETKPEGPRYTTDQWHQDLSYLADLPAGAVLQAVDLPESGGDTIWASSRTVYRALDASLAARLEGLTATHSIEHSGWPEVLRSQPDGEARYRRIRNEQVPVSHPLIRVHPVTGEKYVFTNPKYVEPDQRCQPQRERLALARSSRAVRTPRGAGAPALGIRYRRHLEQPEHLALRGCRLPAGLSPHAPGHFLTFVISRCLFQGNSIC